MIGVLDESEFEEFIYGNHTARRASHDERRREDDEWLIGDIKLKSQFEDNSHRVAPMPKKPMRRKRAKNDPAFARSMVLPTLKPKRTNRHTSAKKIHQQRRIKLSHKKQKERGFDLVLPGITHY